MSNQIFTLAGDMFIKVFGSPVIVALVIISFFLFLLLAAKVPKAAMIVIILPLIVGLSGLAASAYIKLGNFAEFLPIALFLLLALVFVAVLIKLFKG